MTNGCEHLLLFGFIFSNWNQKCYQNAPNLYKNEAKWSQKLIKWCPEASKNRSERQGRALMAERLPKLTKIWANGAKMVPRCSQNGAQKPPKLIQNPSQNWCKNRHRKKIEKYRKYTKNYAKMMKKTIPKSNFSSNLDFVKNLVFP